MLSEKELKEQYAIFAEIEHKQSKQRKLMYWVKVVIDFKISCSFISEFFET